MKRADFIFFILTTLAFPAGVGIGLLIYGWPS